MAQELDSFSDYIIHDQLQALQIRGRRMFGGVGLYRGMTFFGLIWQGTLFFKTDDLSRNPYLKANMKPFQPNPKQILKSYYQVPNEIVENREQLMLWAKEAIRIGQAASKP
ncbi:MAG: TfoX/Sxy family protein [Myxococcaceae bacterium]|nr:TfoX/Sxy family protein [Myxococcaceae bacterium]MBH2006229.1 TfoX/Sxy family protein [Myxococcaceae bacterium]